MQTNKILLTPTEVSQKFFGGTRSSWSILQDVKKKRLPAIHFGTRVYLELNTLNDLFDKQLKTNFNTMSNATEKDGIKKID